MNKYLYLGRGDVQTINDNQIDGRSEDVSPESNDNARELVTVIKNGVPMIYWVWGRPMMNKPLNKPANVITLYEADTP